MEPEECCWKTKAEKGETAVQKEEARRRRRGQEARGSFQPFDQGASVRRHTTGKKRGGQTGGKQGKEEEGGEPGAPQLNTPAGRVAVV